MRTDELATTYEHKTDDELLVLAESEGLTAEAQLVLENELRRRGIQRERKFIAAKQAVPIATPDETSPVRTDRHNTPEFIAAVTRMYRDHFALFLKLTVPAMAVSYVAITLSRQQGRELARDLLREGDAGRNLVLLKVGLISYAGHMVAGLASCLSFAAICVAVRKISNAERPQVSECLSEVGKRIGPVLRLSLVLMGLAWLAIVISGLMILPLDYLIGTRRLGSLGIQVTVMTAAFLGFLLVSRFSLAMPAVVLDDYRIGKAIFRSDELTERKWLTLAILLIKSVLGGYIVAMLPFWVATWLWSFVQLPGWLLTVASYVGVTMVEPFMFIGFALLYCRASIRSGAAEMNYALA